MKLRRRIKQYALKQIRSRMFMRKIEYVRNDLCNQLRSNKQISNSPSILTEEQKKQIDAIWKERYPKPSEITYQFHDYYYKATGIFDPHFIPHDLWYEIIDRHFNDNTKTSVLENKCYFPKLFPDAAMPETIAFRINGTWLDADYRSIESGTLAALLIEGNEVVLKRASASSGGKGVFFLSGENLFEKVMNCAASIQTDIIIQKPIFQHNELAKLNPEAVSTIRHLTLLSDGTARVVSSAIRIGGKGKRVDNASSGGITCGIKENGQLKPIGRSLAGESFDISPATHTPLKDVIVPSFREASELACKLHESFPVVRLVSWDIAIDSEGVPLLVEANLGRGGIDINQLNNGPVFGKDQDKILSEIKWDIPSYRIRI